ncbi:MAG: hypothetical protein V2A72_00540 [Candidatus Omnitrophota bacterium]
MSVLIYGTILFLFSFGIHFLIWKVYLPRKNHTKVLLIIFFGVLSVGIWCFRKDPAFCFQLVLFYSSLALAYIVSYSAIEVDSPSLIMILDIAKAYPLGLTKEEFYAGFSDELLVLPRLNDLVKDGMVVLDKGLYRPTPKGVLLADIFINFRRLLKAPKGG